MELFKNLSHLNYVKIVFGDRDVSEVLAVHIKPVRRVGMTGKRKVELVEKRKDMLLKDELKKGPYTDETFEPLKLHKT